MKLGAEPKKLAALIGLMIVAGLVYWYNSSDEPAPRAAAPRPAAPVVTTAEAVIEAPVQADRKRVTATPNSGEFKPMIGPKRGEARPDPTKIDPTLRLDLLAKVQSVQPEGSMRNLFAFGAAQPAAGGAMPQLPKNVGQIAMGPKGPPPPPPVMGPQTPSGPPPPPPINLKYYGYKISKLNGNRLAFLMDGEDIIVVAENDTVKQRYRVVKINIPGPGHRTASLTVEDIQSKKSQELPLQEDAIG